MGFLKQQLILIGILAVGWCPLQGTPQSSSTPTLFARIADSALTSAQIQQLQSLRNRPTTRSVSPVLITTPVDSFESVHLHVTTQAGQVQSLDRVAWRHPGANTVVWRGIPSGGTSTGEYGILASHQNQVTGVFWIDTTLYRLNPLAGAVHVFYQVVQRQFPPEAPFSSESTDGAVSNVSSRASGTLASSDTQVDYDILVAFTSLAGAIMVDSLSFIPALENQTNTIYQNSGASPRANVVDTYYAYNYEEEGVSMSETLDRLVNENDNYLDEVYTKRSQSGADVVILLVGDGGYCGLAERVYATASSAFAVVKVDCALDRYSFAHEIGHLFGTDHDLGHDSNNDPNLPVSYNHGWFNTYADIQTVMAIKASGAIPRIPYFSDPNIIYEKDGEYYQIGDLVDRDNVRVHNEEAYTVADFNSPPPPPLDVTISGPNSLDAGETGTFTADPTGGTGTYTNYRWWERNDDGGGPLQVGITPYAPPPNEWIELTNKEGQQSIQLSRLYDFSLKVRVYDSHNTTATDIHSVNVSGGLYKGNGHTTHQFPSPNQYELGVAYPNPFNPVTTIRYQVPEQSEIRLTVFNIEGERIRTLTQSVQQRGYYTVMWDGSNMIGQSVAAGVYLYELVAHSQTSDRTYHRVHKVMYLK